MFKKIVMTAAILGFTTIATAADYAYTQRVETSYTLETFLGAGDRVYYNCDSVETNTKSLLRKLGADNIRVRCVGGFDPFTGQIGPAYVTAKYDAPTLTKNNSTPKLASVQVVRLRSRDNCHFMTNTLEALSESLEIDIVSGPRSCGTGRTSGGNFVVEALVFEE